MQITRKLINEFTGARRSAQQWYFFLVAQLEKFIEHQQVISDYDAGNIEKKQLAKANLANLRALLTQISKFGTPENDYSLVTEVLEKTGQFEARTMHLRRDYLTIQTFLAGNDQQSLVLHDFSDQNQSHNL